MRTFAAHVSELDCGGPLITDEGALVVVLAVEPGDAGRSAQIADAASTAFDRLADRLDATHVVISPVPHDDVGPTAHDWTVADGAGELPATLADRLSTTTTLVDERRYPSFIASGTAHPTAFQFQTFRGESQPPDGTILIDLDRLAQLSFLDEPHERWRPEGLFVRDWVLDQVRDMALELGAVPYAARNNGPVGSVQGQSTATRTADTGDREPSSLTYEVYSTATGPQPELAVETADRKRAVEQLQSTILATVDFLSCFSCPLEVAVTNSQSVVAAVQDVVDAPVSTSELHDSVEIAVTITKEHGTAPLAWGTTTETQSGWRTAVAPFGRFSSTITAVAGRDRTVLPIELAPTQLRLLPIGSSDEDTESIARTVQSAGVRVDIDARSHAVGQRIETLSRMGVPLYAVVDAEAVNQQRLELADRRSREATTLSVDTVAEQIGGSDRRQYVPLWFDRE